MSVTDDILKLARAQNETIATAESCTAGMVGAALTAPAGASDIYERGFITYSNAAKIELLGVSPVTLKAYGAVSEEVAFEMAKGALVHSDASMAISITGIAGPGGSDHKPEGRVCFALITSSNARVETVEFGALGRSNVRDAAKHHALTMIYTALSA